MGHQGRLVLGVALALAADPVDRAVRGGGGEPAAGVGRHAGHGPLLQRHHERLARRVLGEVDVAEPADERGDEAAVLLAEDPLDGRPAARGRPVARPVAPRRHTRLHHVRPGSGQALERTDLDLAPARLRALGGELERHVEVGGVDDPEPADVLLGLEVGPVGDHRGLARAVDDGRGRGLLEATGEQPVAVGLELVVEGTRRGERLLHLLLGPVLAELVALGRAVDGKQVLRHVDLLGPGRSVWPPLTLTTNGFTSIRQPATKNLRDVSQARRATRSQWRVSWRWHISTNFAMRAARVAGLFASWTR